MPVPVSEIMSPVRAVVGADTTLRQAAVTMSQHKTGAAIVMDQTLPGPGIVTERDILRCLAEGLDPDATRVSECMFSQIISAAPSWPIGKAADRMLRHHIRHVAVFEEGHLVGIISMRDIIKVLGLSSAEDRAA